MSKTKIGEEQMPDEYYDLERRTEIKATSNRLKKQFLTWRECEIVYSLQHRKLLKLADEAGAIYRFDGGSFPDTWINCITKLHLSVSCCAVWGAGGYFCNTFPRRHDVLYFESTDRNDPGDHCINCNNCTVCIRSGVCHPSVWKYRWIFKGLF